MNGCEQLGVLPDDVVPGENRNVDFVRKAQKVRYDGAPNNRVSQLSVVGSEDAPFTENPKAPGVTIGLSLGKGKDWMAMEIVLIQTSIFLNIRRTINLLCISTLVGLQKQMLA